MIHALLAVVHQVARTMDAGDHGDAMIAARIYLDCYSQRRPLRMAGRTGFRGITDLRYIRWVTRPLAGQAQTVTVRAATTGNGMPVGQFEGLTVTGTSLDAGASITARQPAVFLYRSPGFMARSFGSPSTLPQTRFYFALRAKHGRDFLVRFYDQLAGGISSFSMKSLSNPEAFKRSDAGVLYVDHAEADQAAQIARNWVTGLRLPLRQLSPLGTKTLLPGLSWADSIPVANDPEVSFGQWLAGTLLEAAQQHGRSAGEADLRKIVAARGRELDRIWRDPARAGHDPD